MRSLQKPRGTTNFLMVILKMSTDAASSPRRAGRVNTSTSILKTLLRICME